MKKILLAVLVLVALTLAYLLAWPVGIEPVAWTPPPAPALAGPYAPNDKLKAVQRFGVGVGKGPEGIAVDAAGRLYAGYEDGRIVTFAANGASHQVLGQTGGRPLGLTFGPNGGLVIADAQRGLLHLGGGPDPTVLAAAAEGQPFALTDDADNTRLDKNIYFTDAAAYPLSQVLYEFVEHKGTGRLLEYNVETKATRVLMKGLLFGNGVAVGPDDAYVLVNETAAYRVMRYWLKGEKAGTSEVFIDNLPGLPDNISYNDEHRRFWLALFAPRSPMLDALATQPAWVKKLVLRLPAFLQVQPAHKAWVLALNENGEVIANLQHDAPEAYGPITSVREWGPWLLFGSLTADSLARLPLNTVFPNAPAPPATWQQLKARSHEFVPPKVGETEVTPEDETERR
jgi:sugar lactone lactonase YvrE